MKIIFLDIDGVMNVIPQGHDRYGGRFHPHFIDNLAKIIIETKAKIVISSSWKHSGLQNMKDMWKSRIYPGDVIDITPNFNGNKNLSFKDRYERGTEIKMWLDKHPDITDYVIIDDDSDMLPEQLDHFVKCFENYDHSDYVDAGYGLTKECADLVISILKNKN